MTPEDGTNGIPTPVEPRQELLPLESLTWQIFENLCRRMATDVDGCTDAKTYGESGQKQYGIDIIAWRSNKIRWVYQVRHIKSVTPTHVEKVVTDYIESGNRFDAERLTLCVACEARSTGVIDRLDSLKVAHPELEFRIDDLREISTKLRLHPRLVEEFFGRAWAEAFCGSVGEAAYQASTPASVLGYIRKLEGDLEDWKIASVSDSAADDLYMKQSIRRAQRDGGYERLDDVRDILGHSDHIFLAGSSGSGKTVAISALARRSIADVRNAPSASPIPVVVRLKTRSAIPATERMRNVPNALTELAGALQAVDSLFRVLQDRKQIEPLLIFVDGLGVAQEDRDRVLELAREGHRVICAGQPWAFVPWRGFSVWSLEPWALTQSWAYAEKQLGPDDAERFRGWLAKAEPDILSSPHALDVLIRMWHAGGWDKPAPRTDTEILSAALPILLDQRNSAHISGEESQRGKQLAEEAEQLLRGAALQTLSLRVAPIQRKATVRRSTTGLPNPLFLRLESAGIVTRAERLSGVRPWELTSDRWLAYFASRELRTRARIGAGGLAVSLRPSWTDALRMAAHPAGEHLQEATRGIHFAVEGIVLAGTGAEQVDSWARGLSSVRGEERAALYGLIAICSGETNSQLHSLMAAIAVSDHLEKEVRQMAAWVLFGTRSRDAQGILSRLLARRDDDPELQWTAFIALSMSEGGREIDHDVTNALDQFEGSHRGDELERYTAMLRYDTNLSQFWLAPEEDVPEPLDRIVERLRRGSHAEHVAAFRVLRNWREPIADRLIPLMASGKDVLLERLSGVRLLVEDVPFTQWPGVGA